MTSSTDGHDATADDDDGDIDANARSIARLKAVVDRLRTPNLGCPWDLEQTPTSLVPYLIEECHEAAEAIRREDSDEVCDELGDVLLNVFLQVRIAEEEGRFTLADVAQRSREKIVRRHPHVWGDERGADRATIRENWRRIKAEEKPERPDSALRELPPTLSPLLRAARVGADAARIGFDWPDWTGPRAKIEEELAEVDEVVDDPGASRREIGDLLLAVTSLARHLKVDPEGALADAIDRFGARFRRVEERSRAEGTRDLDRLESFWSDAKRELGEP